MHRCAARIARWAPLNQSLYVGYKVMLAGLLLLGKGDRIAMNSSVETRYPFLDEEVIIGGRHIHVAGLEDHLRALMHVVVGRPGIARAERLQRVVE